MKQLKTWFEAERGRQRALALHLGIAIPSVHYWADGRKPVPMRHAAAIEKFTSGAVTRKDMCREDCQQIWPELAKKEKKVA